MRLNGVLQSRLRSEEALQLFQDFAFDHARAIREVINGRHRNMAELVALVEDAHKFKKWVKGQPENADLHKAYVAEVAKLGWSENVPRKTVRWAIFTTTGAHVDRLDSRAHSIRDNLRVCGHSNQPFGVGTTRAGRPCSVVTDYRASVSRTFPQCAKAY